MRLGIVAGQGLFFGPVVGPEASFIENVGAVVASLAVVAGLVVSVANCSSGEEEEEE